MAPLLFLIFGNVVAGTLNQELGWSYDTWWVAAAVTVFLLVSAPLVVTLIIRAGDAGSPRRSRLRRGRAGA